MEIKLAYGDGQLKLKVPSTVKVDVYEPSAAKKAVTRKDFLKAFRENGGGELLEGPPPLVVVNDAYRSTPTEQVLEWLEAAGGNIIEKSLFLVSTGAHEKPRPEHLKDIFGHFEKRLENRIHSHDAREKKEMYRLGVDRKGGDVYVNRLVFDTARVLIIGSVEPHYFAGFTGGCKSIFPGLTDLATIERNHVQAVSPEAAPLKIDGNPVAEHLWSLLDFFEKDKFFTVQTVLDCRRHIAGAYCGRLKAAFDKAARLSEQLYAPPVRQKYDIVLAELRPPLDSNLYQAQKALENCQPAVADGGSAIVVSACAEGVGSDYFYKLADEWDRESNRPRDGNIRFGAHKLSRVNAMTRRIGVYIHSRLEDEMVRKVFYEPVGDIARFLADKIESGEARRVAVVRDAGHTVLKV
jgi:nickel-dependent lactate racemase